MVGATDGRSCETLPLTTAIRFLVRGNTQLSELPDEVHALKVCLPDLQEH